MAFPLMVAKENTSAGATFWPQNWGRSHSIHLASVGLELCVGKGQGHGGQTILPVPGGARRSEEGTVSQQRANMKLMMGVRWVGTGP